MLLPQNRNAGRARIAIVYHSAAGGTRVAAELLRELLTQEHDVTASAIHKLDAVDEAMAADFIVLCFPTYFLKPSPPMQEFIARLPRFVRPQPVYLLTTYELYSENSLRICAKAAKEAGMIVNGWAAVRAPGSDLTCVLPEWLCAGLYRFEHRFPKKLEGIAREVARLARCGGRARTPPWKWYTPVAQPLQRAFFDGFLEQRARIRILPERCTNCGACVSLCFRGAWEREGTLLRHLPERCELCTRCIHHCTRKAIILSSAFKDNKRLSTTHYADLKRRARKELHLPVEEGRPF